MSDNAFLTLREAAVSAGSFRLGPLSLAIAEKEWFVLLGPSGSGKTTFLNLIAGATPSPPGVLNVGGRDLGPLPPEQRRVAYVSQTGDLFPHLTVAQNVAFGLRFTRRPRPECAERVRHFLALFGLEALAGQRASTVSGGEGRRVALARGLVTDPLLLLLDEPLGMLDPNGRREMQDCLARAHTELGTTTIHVTHDRQEAWSLGTRCGVLMNGRLVQDGPVAEVFRRPATREAALFLGAANILPSAFFGTGGGWAMIRPEQIALAAPGASGARRAKLRMLRDLGDGIEAEATADSGESLRIHLSWTQGRELRPGQDVGLSWRESDVHRWEEPC